MAALAERHPAKGGAVAGDENQALAKRPARDYPCRHGGWMGEHAVQREWDCEELLARCQPSPFLRPLRPPPAPPSSAEAWIWKDDHPLKQDGHLIEEDDHPSSEDVRRIEEDAHPVEEDVHPLEDDAHPIAQDGTF